MKILFLTRYGRLGASSRVRVLQYIDYFQAQGILCDVSPLVSDGQLSVKYEKGKYEKLKLLRSYLRRVKELISSDHDLIWIEKEALPWFPAWLELSLLKGKKYLLDYDDAWFHNYDLHQSKIIRFFYGDRLDRLMHEANAVLVGNDYLGKRAAAANSRRIELIPTVVNATKYSSHHKDNNNSHCPKIVWIGSPTTVKYLHEIAGALQELAKKHVFELVVIGGDFSLQGVMTRQVIWNEDEEVESIANCNIGIMPLIDSPWESGKCGYKLIQYMACGLPVVASPVGVNVKIVDHSCNGFLASSSREWVEYLSFYLENSEEAVKHGHAGRHKVCAKYSLEVMSPVVNDILISLARK